MWEAGRHGLRHLSGLHETRRFRSDPFLPSLGWWPLGSGQLHPSQQASCSYPVLLAGRARAPRLLDSEGQHLRCWARAWMSCTRSNSMASRCVARLSASRAASFPARVSQWDTRCVEAQPADTSATAVIAPISHRSRRIRRASCSNVTPGMTRQSPCWPVGSGLRSLSAVGSAVDLMARLYWACPRLCNPRADKGRCLA
jgi:hypothetical protein